MSSTSWLEEDLEALQLNAGHRDRLVVQEGGAPRRRSFRPCKSSLNTGQEMQSVVCMPIAFHVLCVLTCVRRSTGTRMTVNSVSRLSRACCLPCLCDAYCCGCCDASSCDACACSSTDGDCDVAPAGRRGCQLRRTRETQPREKAGSRTKRWGKYVYCVYLCMHLYGSVCLQQY